MVRGFNIAIVVFMTAISHTTGQITNELNTDEYCSGRSENEFFRKRQDPTDASSARSTCNIYYRCIPAAAGTKSIVVGHCQTGLMFDVDKQTCNVGREVTNCNQWDKNRPPRPRWPLEEGEVSQCLSEPLQIECGDGQCVPAEYYCDGRPDCDDGSDENYCGPDEDPNAADRCNPAECSKTLGCFCSPDGTRIPGDLKPAQTPQMILVTFSGAVNERNFKIFDDIFSDQLKNKGNGCTAKATFFVSHAFTNYSAVQELARRGHEIASLSMTNTEKKSYWIELTQEGYVSEFSDSIITLEYFANLTEYSVRGMRLPGGRSGGNTQFRMMEQEGFTYDSSLAAPSGRLPIWPYTLHYRMPHKCIGTDQLCPSQNFTVWEMVLNELDRRDDPKHDESLTGCHYVDSCANVNEEKQFRKFLDNNLARHYQTNRAPLGLHFTAAYFETKPKFQIIFKNWMNEVSQKGDYYFVTNTQAIKWMESPTELTAINNFAEWNEDCEVTGLPYCSLPNPCPNRHSTFPHEEAMYLYTCRECPATYPWLANPLGQALYIDDLK